MNLARTILTTLLLLLFQMMPAAHAARREDPRMEQGVTQYVDPRIGSTNTGNVFIGPCMPFGMIKPSPDVKGSNPGWKPMPEPVYGFSQMHVSGTGGAPKYGNIVIMPFSRGENEYEHSATRTEETIELGYYATTLSDSGIRVEITSAERACRYRICYPGEGLRGLEIDAGTCLQRRNGKGQRLLGGEVRRLSDTEFCGWTTAEGGWGGGRAYTVYFHIISDTPAIRCNALEKQSNIIFAEGGDTVNLKLGISMVSEAQARTNAMEELPDWDFEATREALVARWEALLGRISIPDASLRQKRMLYTGLYHSMLMPSRRTGEWSKAAADEPYYDDYFTLWDIYRTSLPLISVLAPETETEIVNSLLTIFRHDGYMPDGRSGNSNGATQGSSNAEIVIADAYVKGLDGIDYEEALQAMLKDATVPPADDRYEGRGGIAEYDSLGYIPWDIRNAGSRTVDASLCDHAISVVAQGLGYQDIADIYREKSHNWTNLWRDLEEDGIRGFIMPKDRDGRWLDEALVDRSVKGLPDTLITILPSTSFGRWGGFFYEANSYETSLCMPHDMDRLIELCGGRKAFRRRLDLCFERYVFDAGNEPSFLATSLYHWVGRPDLSYRCINELLQEGFDDSEHGLPGNDDSGAMSSWMVWHMMGLYPLAGSELYLIHTPQTEEISIAVQGGIFTVRARGLSDRRSCIRSARLNGRRYPYSTLRHRDLVAGGVLELRMGRCRGSWGRKMYENR